MILSESQENVLAALRQECDTNGNWPVTVRRLGALTGMTSPASVHEHLKVLIAMGLVERGRQGFRPVSS